MIEFENDHIPIGSNCSYYIAAYLIFQEKFCCFQEFIPEIIEEIRLQKFVQYAVARNKNGIYRTIFGN